MDCKEMSGLRHSPRLFRPWSVMFWQLLAGKQIFLTKITYHVKLRERDCKELSDLRPSPRYFRPWSVIVTDLLASKQIYIPKITYDPKLRLIDCKEIRDLRPSPRLLRPWSVICWDLFTVNKPIFQKSLTLRSRDWWIARSWVFWSLHRSRIGLDLWFWEFC